MINMQQISDIACDAESNGQDALAKLLFDISENLLSIHKEAMKIDGLMDRADSFGVDLDALDELGRLDEVVENHISAVATIFDGKGKPCDARR